MFEHITDKHKISFKAYKNQDFKDAALLAVLYLSKQTKCIKEKIKFENKQISSAPIFKKMIKNKKTNKKKKEESLFFFKKKKKKKKKN
ncbi:hypothetical protein RFI_29238 [Reticulomyxa filosa]|uniref:Uncharacterized protein n=1 Tax=Reticulomyxa filosa TaxID=46433 RepID=X6M1V3_RETFI|nr:hypothetical protein RFI_29238 [Reticulomyxa filosa]|eukprot:ETO08153.1 hypothetical protein RFI_29238 [Reticulomyxa filosa]